MILFAAYLVIDPFTLAFGTCCTPLCSIRHSIGTFTLGLQLWIAVLNYIKNLGCHDSIRTTQVF